jgi:outer membrane protein OmpA-like peptidoglycan-associated protein
VRVTARRSGGRRLLSGPFLAGALAVACATPPAPPPPPPPAPAPPPRADLVVLLPGSAGRPGAVVVQEGGREVVLDTAYASARTGPGGGLDVGQATPEEVRAVFTAALAAEPPRPVTFILYFVEATDQFTPESQALVDQVLLAIATRPAPELTVAGHTDTVGTEQYNDALSLRRAERVRALLVARGIPPDSVVAMGRGKRELLVPTPDGVAEPRNRRVEITVR